tara:strand:- start:187 stop:345 length:159 start_codon:yes stop_codon:yes gene_type:complete
MYKKNKWTKKQIKDCRYKIEYEREIKIQYFLNQIKNRSKPLPQEFFILETDR